MLSDNPEESQVASSVEQPSGDEPTGSSTEPPPKEAPASDELKRAKEGQSAADKKAASLQKELADEKSKTEKANARITSLSERLSKLEEENAKREIEKIGDNPDALSIFTAKQEVRGEWDKIETRTGELDDREKNLSDRESVVVEAEKKMAAAEIASRPEYKGVNPERLVELSDGTPEKMEQLAKLMVAGAGKTTHEIPEGEQPPPSADLGEGLAGELTAEQIDKMTMEQYANHPSVKERFK